MTTYKTTPFKQLLLWVLLYPLSSLRWAALALVCSACGLDTKYGGNEVSASIQEAQQIGVLVQLLRPEKPGWIVRNTPVVELKEAWLEQCWANAKGKEHPHILSGLQLVLVLRDGQQLPERYQMSLPSGHTFWRNNKQLFLPLKDTIQKARYVVYLQSDSTTPPTGKLDSLVLQLP